MITCIREKDNSGRNKSEWEKRVYVCVRERERERG